jgi:hypothetical protein
MWIRVTATTAIATWLVATLMATVVAGPALGPQAFNIPWIWFGPLLPLLSV